MVKIEFIGNPEDSYTSEEINAEYDRQRQRQHQRREEHYSPKLINTMTKIGCG